MPFKSKKQWRKFFAMEADGELPKGKAREWAHETSKDYSDLPTRVKQAGYWDMLVKLGAVDPTLKAHVERVARRMGFSSPSAQDLEQMFPAGWEKQSPGWQAQFEKSQWFKDQNSARIGGSASATPAGDRPSWRGGNTWGGRATDAGFRTAPLSRGAQRVSDFARGTMRHHNPLFWGGLGADIAAGMGAREAVSHAARSAGLGDKETNKAQSRLGRHRLVGGALGFGAGAAMPYLANLAVIKGTGFRPVARRLGILNPLLMGLTGYNFGSLAGTPSGYMAARKEIDKAASEEPVYPDNFLLKRLGVPAVVGGAVGGALGPIAKPAFMDWLKRRAPNLVSKMNHAPGGRAEKIITDLLAGAATGALSGFGTGYVADKLVKRQLAKSEL